MEINKEMVKEEASSFISATTDFGIKGIKSFAKVFILFFLVNIIALVIAITKLGLSSILYTFIIGVVLTFVALYFTYKHVLTLGITHVYQYSAPVFRKISNVVVDKFMSIPIDTNNASIAKAIDGGKILSETYGKKVPSFGKKAINFIMRRIPFLPIITDLNKEIGATTGKEEIQNLAYAKVDSYIKNNILNTGLGAVYIVLIINIVIQVALIYYLVLKNTPATPEIPAVVLNTANNFLSLIGLA